MYDRFFDLRVRDNVETILLEVLIWVPDIREVWDSVIETMVYCFWKCSSGVFVYAHFTLLVIEMIIELLDQHWFNRSDSGQVILFIPFNQFLILKLHVPEIKTHCSVDKLIHLAVSKHPSHTKCIAIVLHKLWLVFICNTVLSGTNCIRCRMLWWMGTCCVRRRNYGWSSSGRSRT